MKRLLPILLSTAFILILVGGIGAWRIGVWLNSDAFMEDMADELSDILERKVSIDGPVELSFFPWLGLAIEDVTIANVAGFDGDFSTIGRLAVKVRLLPLLDGDIDADVIEAEDVAVSLVRGNDGERNNWDNLATDVTSADAEDPGGFDIVGVRGIIINDADISFTDRQSGTIFRLNDLNVRTGSFTPGRLLAYDVSGTFNVGRIVLDARLKGKLDTSFSDKNDLLKDSVLDLVAKGDFLPHGANARLTSLLDFDPVSERLKASRLELAAFGVRGTGHFEVDDLFSNPAFVGGLSLHPFNPAEVVHTLVPDLDTSKTDGLKRMQLGFDFSGSPKSLSFTNVSLFLDGATLTGKVGFDLLKRNPSFDLAVDRLDLDQYSPLFISGQPWIWGDFGLDFFRELTATGAVQAKSLLVGERNFSNVNARMSAKDGRVQASAGGELAGGRFSAALDGVVGRNKRTNNPNLSLKFDAQAEHVETAEILPDMQPRIKGTISSKVRLTLVHGDCPAEARSVVGLHGLRMHGEMQWDALNLQPEEGELLQSGPMRLACDITPAEGGSGYPFSLLTTLHGNVTSPKFEANLRLEGPIRLTPKLDHVVFSGTSLSGKALGFFTPDGKQAMIDTVFEWDSRSNALTLQRSIVQFLGAEVSLNGTFSKPFSDDREGAGNFAITNFNLKKTLELYGVDLIRMSDPKALTDAELAGTFSLKGERARLAGLSGRFDGATVAGSIVVPSILKNGFEVDLKGGDVNIDQYFKYSEDVDPTKYRNSERPKAPPVEMPLESLRHINVRGQVRADSALFCEAHIAPAAIDVDSWDGLIRIVKAEGGFYGGKLSGNWTADARGEEARTQVQLELDDFQAAPFMKDVAGRNYVAGTGSISLDLSGHGKTDYAILRTLEGSMALKMKDGSYKFSGWDKKSTADSRTSFRTAKGAVKVDKGRFEVQQLDVKSPVMDTATTGWFDLADDRIEMDIKATLVAVPGATIRLSGRLSDPKVTMPPDKIFTDTFKNILGLPQRSFKFFRDLFF